MFHLSVQAAAQTRRRLSLFIRAVQGRSNFLFPVMKHAFFLLCLALLLLAGCSAEKGTARLSGRVTLDGKAIETGTVQVVSDDGKRYDSGAIGKDGKYEVARAPVGDVKLSILIPELPPAPPGGLKVRPDRAAGGPSEEVTAAAKAAQAVPKHYMDPARSGLSGAIKTGDNTLDLPLTRKGAAGKRR